MKKRILNWQPDLPDARDKIYAPKVARRDRLPQAVDLRPLCSPVEDQGNLGSCTGNAIAGAIELLEVKAGKPLTDISRLFIYYQERAYEGTIGEDSGAFIRDGIKAVRKVGAAREDLWPYVVSRFADKPSAAAYVDAKGRKFKSYQRILTLNGMLDCLAAGFPFVFGFSVYSDFMSSRVARTGVLNMPKPSETMEGGHAVLAVGYDQATRRFIVRNSWGSSWGVAGYFTIPFDYLADRNLSDDMWTVRG
jgi:C1A family cysteine protease